MLEFALFVFAIRVVLGIVFAVVLTRFFFPGASLPWIAGLAIFLVGMSYVMEYFHRKKGGPGENP
jgi:hypothetical protein